MNDKNNKSMKSNKSSGTIPEILLGKAMFARGLRYRKNNKTVYGKPDFTFKSLKLAIFVDGEFWHGKNWEQRKNDHKTNIAFWTKKIERNIERDEEVNNELVKNGWTIIRFWAKDVEKNSLNCVMQIESEIKNLKMNFKEKISLETFGNKHFRIKLLEPDNNEEAVLTHYIHNATNGISKFYKKEAFDFTKRILQEKYPEDEITEEIVEEALKNEIFNSNEIAFHPIKKPKFKFIDLFAGIGGFRLALQNLGGKCVFTSEWDKEAKRTYKANFGEVPFGDITKEKTKGYIPDGFDILCAGFPCQAFSIAGKRGGFEDTRGTLFFDVAEIIKKKQPKAIFLENVKGLRSHDKGKTLATILNVLREDLGYYVPEPQIVNAKDFGVPQNRERIYIVGFHPSTGVKDFSYPEFFKQEVTFGDVKEKDVVPTKYYLSTQYLQTLENHKARHESKGNGFGFQIIQDHEIANAVVCGGMGRERNLVYDDRITDFTPTTKIKGEVNREGIRKMTPREWARLQGFPDNFIIPVADASAYKQFGNSVAVPAIQATAKEILKTLQIIKN
ncbi:DNA mismatch endonuclease Vsr [Chryseobacterium zhengzhouense]|uniref:Cytosine-specific methyltransferase n=1 Tax=Chryseobacterium zhengzhouense TaxID=1636086 RepID=A0ABW2LW87_9FLAO